MKQGGERTSKGHMDHGSVFAQPLGGVGGLGSILLGGKAVGRLGGGLYYRCRGTVDLTSTKSEEG